MNIINYMFIFHGNYIIFLTESGLSVEMSGKTLRFDHLSPEYDKLYKHQINRPFGMSIRIGPKWSRGPFLPFMHILALNIPFATVPDFDIDCKKNMAISRVLYSLNYLLLIYL